MDRSTSRQRDADHFTAIYSRCYGPVRRFVARRVAPSDIAEVVDEAFLVAWRRRHDVDDVALPWILGIAANLARQHYRARRREYELQMASVVDGEAVNDTDFDERLVVLAALESLADTDREALMLIAWDGLSRHDAAAVLGCSLTAFTVRLHRARKRLAAALDFQDGRTTGPTAPDVSAIRQNQRSVK